MNDENEQRKIATERWRAEVDLKLQDLLDKLDKVYETLMGNGKEGLVVSVDRNTQSLKNYNKFLWIIVTGVVAALLAAIF